MAGAAALAAMAKGAVSEFFTRIIDESGIIVMLSIAALLLMIFVSYSLSLSFYQKREF
jgi:hypothetical protein